MVLAYFVTIDPNTGRLVGLEVRPFETKRFQFHRAGRRDSEWLQDRLNREGERFGTRVKLETGGRLVLELRR